MKHIKKLLVLFLVINVFNSCDNEETSYALDDLSAPTNIKAVFNISQDDTGTVTVTPTAEGASTFEIYFGDEEGETPTKVSPGETATNIYAEGEFNLRIVAIGMTGLKSELVRVVTISFSAPTDLDFTAVISDSDPFEVTVTPNANNATVYDVFFGDVEDEEPTTIMDGESAIHVYAEVGDYDIRVVARGAGSATIELTKSITISGASNGVTLPITFEDPTVNYVLNGFGASDFGPIPVAIIDNPDASGSNTSAKVLEVNKLQDAQTFAGVSIPLEGAIDFSTSTSVTIKVWSPRVGTPIRFKIEDSTADRDGNGNPVIFAEVEVNSTVASAWEELTFDMSNPTAGAFNTSISFDTAILFPDFGSAGQGEIFYFDDVAVVGGGSSAKPQLPIDFQSTTIDYTINGFGASDFGAIPAAVIDNPDASGVNTSTKVMEINKLSGAQTFAGASIPLAGAIDFSSGTTVKIKVWSPRIGTPIRFKIEDSTADRDGNGNPVVFAEVEVNSTVAMAWEELSFDMTNPTAGAFNTSIPFDTAIVFPDFGSPGQGESFYFDDIAVSGSSAGAKPQLPIGFQSTTIDYTINGFGSSNFGPIPASIIDNPDASGVNTTTKVLEIEKLSGAQTFAGASIPLAGAIDFSSGTTVTIKVWSPRIGTPIRFKIEDSSAAKDGNGNPVTFAEVEVNSTVAMAWEVLSFDMTNPTAGTFNTSISFDTAIVFPDFGSPGQGEKFYFDDIAVTSGGSGGGSSSGKVSFPVNFETPETGADANWIVFENDTAPLEIVSNPNASGINTSSTVAKLTATPTNAPYAGTITSIETPYTLSTSNSVIKMMVFKDKIGPVGVKLAKGEGTVDEILVNNTKIGEWEELTFDFTSRIGFPEANGIDALVVFPDFENRSSTSVTYFDNITRNASSGGGTGGGGTGGGGTRAEIPTLNFEGTATMDGAFEGGATGTVIANPVSGGINTSGNVYEFNKANGSAWFSGTFKIYGQDIDLSTKKTFSLKVYSPKAGINVRFQLEKEGDQSSAFPVDRTVNTANQWVTLTFDFSAINASNAYDKIVVFLDFDDVAQTPGDGTVYYIDDITQQ